LAANLSQPLVNCQSAHVLAILAFKAASSLPRQIPIHFLNGRSTGVVCSLDAGPEKRVTEYSHRWDRQVQRFARQGGLHFWKPRPSGRIFLGCNFHYTRPRVFGRVYPM